MTLPPISKTVRRSLIGAGVLLALAAVGWWFLLRPAPVVAVEWQGYAEADYVKVGPTQPGLITKVHVARGDAISVGQPLFDQDDVFDLAASDQAAQQLAQAENLLANLRAPGRSTEITGAEANLAESQAARDKAQADLERSQKLLVKGYATDQLVDQQASDLRSATSKVQGLEAALQQMRAPLGRTGEITGQAAAVDAARAALAMARWRVAQRHAFAPVSGIVADVLSRPGETLSAGAPVVSILPPANLFVRFFLPEKTLAQVHPGDAVTLSCDTCALDLTATISFIAPQTEFTPPVIYSESTRGKFVFLAEARPTPAGAQLLNPGQPVTVRPGAPRVSP